MPIVIFVDSSFRLPGGSHSNFQIQLNETVNVEDGRLRLDKISFVNSVYTVTGGINQYMYFNDPNQGGQIFFAIPEQAYTGKTLADAITQYTRYLASYNPSRNELSVDVQDELVSTMTDENLKAGPPAPNPQHWPEGASPAHPMSINNIIGNGMRKANKIIAFNFVNMSLYHNLYLRAKRLTCHNMHGPLGEADIICKIPVTAVLGNHTEGGTPDGVYYDVGTHSYRMLDFRLTDHANNVVDLRNNAISFQITID